MQLTSANKRLVKQSSRYFFLEYRAQYLGDPRDAGTCALAVWTYYLLWLDLASNVLDEQNFPFARAMSPEIINRVIKQFNTRDKIVAYIENAKQQDEILRSAITDYEVSNFAVSGLSRLQLPYCRQVAKILSGLTLSEFPIPIYLVRTMFCYLERITLHGTEGDTDAWLAFDRNLRRPNYELLNKDVLNHIRSCSKWWDINPYSIPITGGAVSDVRDARGSQARKVQASCIASEDSWKTICRTGILWPNTNRSIGNPHSRLLWVPKGYNKVRWICAEPTAQAWMQRVVNSRLVPVVKNLSKHHGHPDDAGPNRSLVRNFDYSTIDLSNASDSVHRNWIDILFTGTLNRCLKMARSTHVDVNGSLYELNKFAAMGGGNTFAMQIAVFSTIVQSVYADYDIHKTFAIHGDDIIVANEAYDPVCMALEEQGFTVNLEKSYTVPYKFRESCGHDYFEVGSKLYYATPLRWSRHANSLFGDMCSDFIDGTNPASGISFISLRNKLVMTDLTPISGYYFSAKFTEFGYNYYSDICESYDYIYPIVDNPWLWSPTGPYLDPDDPHPLGIKVDKRRKLRRTDEMLNWALLQEYPDFDEEARVNNMLFYRRDLVDTPKVWPGLAYDRTMIQWLRDEVK